MRTAALNIEKLFSPWPLAILSVCFAAGILLASFLPSVSVWAWLVLTLLPAAAAFAFRDKRIATAFVATAFLLAGAFSFAAEKGSVAPDRVKALIGSRALPTYGVVELTGFISSPIELTPYGKRFLLTTRLVSYKGIERPASGIISVFVVAKQSSAANISYGSLIRFTGILSREDEYRAPGVISNIAQMDLDGVDASARIKSPLLIERLGEEPVFLPLAFVYRQRAAAVEGFRDHFSPSTAGVLAASLLGDRSLLDKQTADVYREGGTFHVLVISGLHITFIAGILLLIARSFTRRRWLHFAAAVIPLWIYTLAVGADLPVVRASLMITAGLIGYAMHRTKTVANQLGLAVLLLLAVSPASLFDASFQLTLASVAAIALFALPLLLKLKAIGAWMPSADEPFPPNVPSWLLRFCETLYWKKSIWERHKDAYVWSANIEKLPLLKGRIQSGVQRLARYIFEALFVSFAVQLTILPLSVIYFHRVSLGSIFTNLWVGFFLAIESFAAVIGLLLANISEVVARPLFALAELCNSANLAIPEAISNITFLSFRLPAYSGAARTIYFAYAAVVVFAALLFASWNVFAIRRDPLLERIAVLTTATMLAFTALITVHPFSAPSASGKLRVDVIDVGQGDSIFVTFPNGETMLIDGGGRHLRYPDEKDEDAFQPDTSSVGERVVSPVLWERGISRLDYLVASHADIDHTGGLVDVAHNFSVRKAFLGRLPSDDPELDQLLGVLRERNTPIEILARGQTLEIGGVRVEILYPTGDPSGPSDNDHSLVMRLVYGNRSFLLTGDIERGAERELLSSGTQLSADVVKVAHHGSRTSSTADLVAATHAAWAIISVGRHSQFGHPHQEVLSAWQGSGAAVLTTGEFGMITVETDGKEIEVSSFATPDPSP